MGISLSRLTDDELLEMRLCDLPLSIRRSRIQRSIKRLNRELKARGILFRPHVWISEEFFTPDGIAGFAVPFYLLHPRLRKLERKQMLEVEGGTEKECMRILRHEAGHALDNAYRLHHRKSWRNIFGSFGKAYPTSYKPKPDTRNYVLHLNAWYAQAHPAEDYAETFAVWLQPGSRWRKTYKGWPAFQKLEYIDQLLKKLAGKQPASRKRKQVEPLSSLKRSLREHYEHKRELYSLDYPSFYERDLRRIFSGDVNSSRPFASTFIRKYRKELRRMVAEGTGVHPYTIDHVLRTMMERARKLKLKLSSSERVAKRQAMIVLTVHTMNIIHSGKYRFQYGV